MSDRCPLCGSTLLPLFTRGSKTGAYARVGYLCAYCPAVVLDEWENGDYFGVLYPVDPEGIQLTVFADSPDSGEGCKCSLCGKEIEGMVFRFFLNKGTKSELRFHRECYDEIKDVDFGEVTLIPEAAVHD